MIKVNTLYSLIGENNIYNAITMSYKTAPSILQPDLNEFISKIEKDNACLLYTSDAADEL